MSDIKLYILPTEYSVYLVVCMTMNCHLYYE